MNDLHVLEPGDLTRYAFVYFELSQEKSRQTGHGGNPACWFAFGAWDSPQMGNSFYRHPDVILTFDYFESRMVPQNCKINHHTVSAAYWLLIELTGMMPAHYEDAVPFEHVFRYENWRDQLVGVRCAVLDATPTG